MPAECDQFPATPVTGAAGFSSLIRRKSAAELCAWSSTTSSAMLQNICSGTREKAIARAKLMGLRRA